MAERARLLILGGTGEALALAEGLAGDPGIEVVTSLAGRTRSPTPPPGRVRTGGFGGVDGLRAYLEAEVVDLVIDATHPFAAEISRNAAAACDALGLPRLRLDRPPWGAVEGDNWISVPDNAAAARRLPGLARRVFLTVGRRELAAYTGLDDLWFLVRLIEPPTAPLPLAKYELLLARGPFGEAEEVALFERQRIEALVTKNSGGLATAAKLAAARSLALPVVMIERPAPPPGEAVESVKAAVAWVAGRRR
jgi:precorrin-6A/cobalt-precorrin-6A reductase